MIATGAGGAINRHLMGFSLPHHGSPQKGTLKRPRPPRRGLFSLINVGRKKVLGGRLCLCGGGGIRGACGGETMHVVPDDPDLRT
jgi:hypothetical protein